MMTTSSPISADQAARYYRHYRTENAKEYYVEGEVEGEWAGKGAAMLGLSGGVSGRTFKRVLDGKHPTKDKQIVQGSSANDGKRVAGWDVTFAAPKSVSLVAHVALIGRPE
jgi:conjugative relaxase-like TrwC/TraI family protein